ncbi:hypothetical protein CSOJ01_03656 [Colletotrichum sojae]|uniref:Uncharacterized protein n=1 Tax=Colletotrichum sojae TaxID=2175907 RepID=A0A8H6JL32_9PEZI|nr:hypothetical protein CSOJ01_03656 [Colletotrichum sojae]
MLHNAGAARRLLVLSLAIARRVLGQSCNGFNITSDESAEAARRCPDINGDVMIFPDNITDVNLDGVENINGSLSVHVGCQWWWTDKSYGCSQKTLLRSVSSTTLKTINERLSISQNENISSLSFPKLASVGRSFNLDLDNLEYLDITSLETIEYLRLDTPKLSTMKHENLRNVTAGMYSDLEIMATSLESVDSLIRSPLDLRRLRIEKSLKLKQITLGISSASEVYIAGNYSWYSDSGEKIEDGQSGSAKLVLGGPETKEMRIQSLRIMNSTASIERASSLVNLEVDFFQLDGNYFMQHLALPFDKLRSAQIRDAPALKWLSNVPQAVDWKQFTIDIADMPMLNLSSEYMIDEKGDLVRSWYWPQSDLRDVQVYANVTNQFFDTFPKGDESSTGLAVYNYGAFGSMDCDALKKEKEFEYGLRCANVNDEASLSTRQATTKQPFLSS